MDVAGEQSAAVSGQENPTNKTDVLLIGAGVMSATLGTLLKQLQPDWDIALFERLDAPAVESSGAWNNAGTGHSALCELNYTPRTADGVDITKAINVNEQFQVSRQWWSHAVKSGVLGDPAEWIRLVPHVSFISGADGGAYLKARYEALSRNPLFPSLQYIDDRDEFDRRLPLMAKGRDRSEPVALNWTEEGTDVNFGALTKQLLAFSQQAGTQLHYGHEVRDLKRGSSGGWDVEVRNRHTGTTRTVHAKFVFAGAGGYALKLLQKSGIPEIKGIGGFPISAQFLRCTNEDIVAQHQAKVYGTAAVGAPPMSVPHLDTRVIDGKRGLLFGPFAGWTPKFLKHGRFIDLPSSIRPGNLPSLVGVGLHEVGLIKYLVGELLKNHAKKVETLREFYPEARDEDWEIITAGQRVQVIRRAPGWQGGSLEFGTAVINAADGSIAGLLGASPGASTAVNAMLQVLKNCFGSQFEAWQPKIEEMIPSFGRSLSADTALLGQVWEDSQAALNLG